MNSVTMVNWLHAMVQAMPHGGKTKAAEMLGLTPSGLSKLLNNPERGFDEKTCRAIAWIESSKAARYNVAAYPILHTIQVGPMIVETRKGEGGSPFYVWRTAAAKPA